MTWYQPWDRHDVTPIMSQRWERRESVMEISQVYITYKLPAARRTSLLEASVTAPVWQATAMMVTAGDVIPVMSFLKSKLRGKSQPMSRALLSLCVRRQWLKKLDSSPFRGFMLWLNWVCDIRITLCRCLTFSLSETVLPDTLETHLLKMLDAVILLRPAHHSSLVSLPQIKQSVSCLVFQQQQQLRIEGHMRINTSTCSSTVARWLYAL